MTPPDSVAHTANAPAIGYTGRARRYSAHRALITLLLPEHWRRLRVLVDVLFLGLAASAALFAAPATEIRVDGDARWCAGLFPLVAFILLRVRRPPDDRLNASVLDTLGHVTAVLSIAAMLVVAGDGVLAGDHPSRLALRLWLFSTVYVGVARTVLLSVRREMIRRDSFATPTLIVGAGKVGEHLVERLVGEPRYGLRPVGFLDSDPLFGLGRGGPASVPVLGGPHNLAAAIQQTGARKVILAFSSEPDHVLLKAAKESQRLGVEVALVPRLYEAISARSTLDHVGGLPLVQLHPTNPYGWQFAVKHGMDGLFAGLALLALAPLMLVIALLIRLTSSGPILFRQRRVGRDGHEFELLKFRTMMPERVRPDFEPSDGCAPGGVEGTDRRTGVGRYLRNLSLDELPQFINVVRGDMSLIGPRPERPEYVAQFTAEVDRYQDRHRVKSGITGWAQVHGLRGQTSIADRVEWDNWYIQNWSLGLDFRIAAMTIGEILRLRG